MILAIILFNLVLYWPTLFYGLVIDDIEWYKKYPEGLPSFRQCNSNILSYLQRRIYGVGTISRNLIVEHAITLSLHITTAILISTVSPVGSLLYSCHPVTHQTSVWLNGRRYAILNLLILILYLNHLVYLSLLFIPPIVIHFLHRNAPRRKLYRIVRPPHVHVLVVIKSLGFNLFKFTAIPPIMSLYPFLENTSMSDLARIDPYAVVGFIGIVLMGISHPVILLLLLLASSTIPYTQTCADRYLSLPTIFLCISVGQLSLWCLWMIVPFTIRTILTLPMYRNIQSFYNYHASHYPKLLKLPLLKRLYPEIKSCL